MKLSIVIPVYNEEQTIAEVIERVWAVDLGALEREVIIANDGSSDGTRHAIDASRWINDPRVKSYDSPINLGKGAGSFIVQNQSTTPASARAVLSA